MRGAVFAGHRKIELREFPDPTPGPGEVVLAIKASGMCGSDLKFYRPAPGEAQRALGLGDVSEPLIGGHEPCGVVEAVGPGVSEAEARPGMRVMCHHYCRLRRLQALPGRLVAALPQRLRGLRRDRARRPCRLHEGAGAHPGAAAGRAVVHDRCGDLLRQRHRLQCAAAHGHLRPRHAGGVRPGPGRPRRDPARHGDGRARVRDRHDAGAPRSSPRTWAPRR